MDEEYVKALKEARVRILDRYLLNHAAHNVAVHSMMLFRICVHAKPDRASMRVLAHQIYES